MMIRATRRAAGRLLAAAALLAAAGGLARDGAAPAAAQEATEAVELYAVCNNVAATWPTGTRMDVVAQAISPPEALIAIWRFDNPTQKFTGYAPQYPQASDLDTFRLIDPLFICMRAPGTLNRPAI